MRLKGKAMDGGPRGLTGCLAPARDEKTDEGGVRTT